MMMMFKEVFLSARGVQEETTFVCLFVLLAKSDVNIKHKSVSSNIQTLTIASRSLNNDECKAKEKVTWKYTFAQLWLFCNYSLVRIPECWRSTLQASRWERCLIKYRQIKSIYGCMLKLSSNRKWGNFTLLFWRELRRIVLTWAHAESARRLIIFHIRLIRFLICGVVIAFPFVDAKALC